MTPLSASPPAPAVLYLLDYTELGGGETSFLAFADALRRERPEVRPVAIVPGAGPVADGLAALRIETRPISFPRYLRRGALPWFSLAAARRIGRVMDQVRPVLVHANNFFGMLYAGGPARRRAIPLLWTCHGAFDIDTAIKVWTARRCATRVSCVSEAVRREAERRLGGAPPTVTDYLGIPPFADATPADTLRAAVRAELGAAPEDRVIAVVGRYQPIKGHALLLDALAEIRRRVPRLAVWLIGEAGNDGERAHKRAIEARVRAEGWSGCVKFLGFRADARRLLRGVDALVIPSRAESFSMAAVEGLEAGVPVIGPDGWGPREIIEAPATGLRFRPGDAAELAARVADALLAEGEGRAFNPQAGPARARELFSVEAHLRRTLALYRELISTGPGTPPF